MFDVRGLSLLALFFLFSDSFGAVIQPRLYDDSSNHRRSMLLATKHIPIHARSDRATGRQADFKRPLYTGDSTEAIEAPTSSKRRKLEPSEKKGVISSTGGSPEASTSTHRQGGNPGILFREGLVFLVTDLDPLYSKQLHTGPGPSVVVVRNSKSSHPFAQALINVQELGDNTNFPLKPAVFKACSGVEFKTVRKLENFVLRYLPWSFFEGKESVGAIKLGDRAQLQTVPDTSFEAGDIVQMPASNVDRPGEDNETFVTALCVTDVPPRATNPTFAVLTKNPREIPYFPASGLPLPTYTGHEVFVLVKVVNREITRIARLSSQDMEVMKSTIPRHTRHSASIRPGRWVRFLEQSLLRWPDDTRTVETKDTGFFGIVLKSPETVENVSSLVLTVGVYVHDAKNQWGEGHTSASTLRVDGMAMGHPWKMIPGYVVMGGVTSMEKRILYPKMDVLLEKVFWDDAGQPRPHIWSDPCVQ